MTTDGEGADVVLVNTCGFVAEAKRLMTRATEVDPGFARGWLGLAVSYSFYAGSAVISFFLVQRFIHETKGKELEEMQG